MDILNIAKVIAFIITLIILFFLIKEISKAISGKNPNDSISPE